MGNRILVVDDAAFMRMTLKNILIKGGYEIAGEAADGKAAVEKYKELKPDLVLLDVTMPGLDGIGALKEIMAFDPNAVCIMCSAMGQQSIVIDAIQAGAVPAQRLQVPGYDRSYTKMKIRHTGDIFLRHSWDGERLGIQASAGVALSPYGAAPLWNAHLDWRPSRNWHLDAGVSQSMRLPTFTDLYYTAPGHKGNPDLHPEKALTLKAGAVWGAGSFTLGATGFYRRSRNVIDWVRESADADWQCMQLTRLDTWGGDLRAEYRSETWLRGVTLLYGHLWSSKGSAGLISEYALDFMRNKLSLNLLLSPWTDRLELELSGTLYDRAGNYAAADHTTQPYSPYFLLNANLGFETGWIRQGSLRLYVEAENLANTVYFDYGGLLMPGLWLNAGLMIRI